MRDLTLMMSVLLLAGCPELVRVDDPRRIDGGGSAADPGYCSGSSVFCEDRALAQCNSGCTLQPRCVGADFERCASQRDPDLCDADPACRWSVDACQPDRGGGCGIYQSRTACTSDMYADCVWENACDGTRAYCIDLTTAAACTANIGCEWVP